MKLIIPILAVLALAGCISPSAQQKALTAVSTMQATAAKLQVQTAAAAPLVAQVSGSNQTLANDLSYATAIAADAQTLAPLLSGLIGAIPTTSGSN